MLLVINILVMIYPKNTEPSLMYQHFMHISLNCIYLLSFSDKIIVQKHIFEYYIFNMRTLANSNLN